MTLRRVAVAAILTVALAAVIVAARLLGMGELFGSLNFALAPPSPPDSVVIVGIDAASISQTGGWPWPRSVQAALFSRIAAAAPRAVAIDILFPRRPGDAGTDSLEQVLRTLPNLVLPFRIRGVGAARQSGGVETESSITRHRFLRLANQEQLRNTYFFAAAVADAPDTMLLRHAARSGFVNVATLKSTQQLREALHVISLGNEYYPSFGLAAAAAFKGCGPTALVLDGDGVVWVGGIGVPLSSYAASAPLRYRGRSGAIPTISAAAVLSGAVDLERLRGKLVFVGITDAAAGADFFITPVGNQFPGVEMWATSAADIVQRFWIRQAGAGASINWLLVCALFPGLALFVPYRRKHLALLCGAALVLMSVMVGVVLFQLANYQWNPVNHLLAWLFAVGWFALQRGYPTLIEIGALQLEPPARSPYDTPPPPRPEDFLASIPSLPTANHVRVMLEKHAPGSARNLAESFGVLCNGRIIRPLGSGGMADVYLIWNPRLEVYRAVKVIKPGFSPKIRERFETEIKIVSHLDHPNIVRCFGVGEWHSLPCLEMEYINGVSMDAVLARCTKLTTNQSLAVGILICRALQYAHTSTVSIYGKAYRGVIHRDLKPANIMLSRGARIALTDFGIARPSQVSLHTADIHAIVGTLPYLAPEQLGGGEVRAASDIYALGVTLYELLSGVRAFPQTEATPLVSAKAAGTISPLRASAELPKAVIEIVERAMATEASDRFESARAMGAALESALARRAPREPFRLLQGIAEQKWNREMAG